MTPESLTLASGSAIRLRILTSAGVAVTVEKPSVDEAALKADMSGRGASGEDIAQALADAKAVAVSRRRPGLVIGGDQVLRFNGVLHDKAENLTEARARLAELAGETHELVGGVALARDGVVVRRHLEVSRLRMRALSDAALDRYMAAAGDAILASVGCYQFEGLGAQLFDRVDGDYFAILGLPLLPLLAMLRAEGALPA